MTACRGLRVFWFRCTVLGASCAVGFSQDVFEIALEMHDRLLDRQRGARMRLMMMIITVDEHFLFVPPTRSLRNGEMATGYRLLQGAYLCYVAGQLHTLGGSVNGWLGYLGMIMWRHAGESVFVCDKVQHVTDVGHCGACTTVIY